MTGEPGEREADDRTRLIGYWNRVIETVENVRDGRGLLYLSMWSRGLEEQMPLRAEFERRGVPYQWFPSYFDRRQRVVTSPRLADLRSAYAHFQEACGGAAALIMDDSISSGSGTLSLRQTLRRIGVSKEDIVISAILDHVGITRGLCLLGLYPDVERLPTADGQLRELQQRFALYRSWHHADMEPRPSFTERLLFKPFGSLSAFRAQDIAEVFRRRY